MDYEIQQLKINLVNTQIQEIQKQQKNLSKNELIKLTEHYKGLLASYS